MTHLVKYINYLFSTTSMTQLGKQSKDSRDVVYDYEKWIHLIMMISTYYLHYLLLYFYFPCIVHMDN